MLDIKFVREHPHNVQEAAKNKGFDVDVSHVLELDKTYRELFASVQKLREVRNRFAREQNIEKGKEIKVQLEKQEYALRAIEEELHNWLLKIPNLPRDDVPVGKDETENKVLRKWGEPQKFSFEAKDHGELGEVLDIIDVKRAAKIAGTRFAIFKNDGVFLENALVQLAFDVLVKEGFTPVIPPVLMKRDVMRGLGYMEHGADEDMFHIPKDDFVLIGTAEHALVAMHKDELFAKNDLPKRYVGFSAAFRREAGSYGKDTRGILRVHQFAKVEMVSFVAQEGDDKEHEYLLSLEEKLFQLLAIPYRVVKMCTGDLGFPAARKYDIEAWIPSQQRYREVTSASTTTDFQARRLNVKYQDGNEKEVRLPEKKFVHILNATAFAIGRTIIAILENYQQEDGSVVVPKVLQKYLGKEIIMPKM